MHKDILENHNRRTLYELISKKTYNFTQLMEETGLKNGALAYHLQKLEKEGLITSERVGKPRFYFPTSKKAGATKTEQLMIDVLKEYPQGLNITQLTEKVYGTSFSSRELPYIRIRKLTKTKFFIRRKKKRPRNNLEEVIVTLNHT